MTLLSIYYPQREDFSSRRMSADQNGSYEDRIYYVKHENPNKIWVSGMLPRWMTPHPNWVDLPNFYAESIQVDPPTPQFPAECKVTIRYREYLLGLTPVSEDWQWDFTSHQQHISSVPNDSYAIYYPADAYAGLAIGHNGQKTEGVDVSRTSEQLIVTKVWDFVDVLGREVIHGLTNTVNSSYWFDYYPGEVLFTGAQIRRIANGFTRVQYTFSVQRVQPNFFVQLYTGEYVEVSARPWDYVWYKYVDGTIPGDGGSEHLTRGIKSIHMNQVYDYGDFHILGFTGPYA